MATNSATVVAASLDSSQLEASINSLVNMVAQKTKAMADNFTSEVKRMENAVKNLGNIKIDSGGAADGGSSRRAKLFSQEGEVIQRNNQIAKEYNATLDQQAAAIRKASQVSVRTGDAGSIRNADTLQTMNIQLDLLRERLREARQQYSSFVAMASSATKTGDKGLYQFATEGVHKYGDEVRTLIPQIRGLQNAIQQMGDVIAPQGHTIQNYVNSLQKTNPELAQLNEQFKKGQSELQNQSTSYSNATQSAQRYTEEIRKQAQAIRESAQWREKGYATVGGVNVYNLEKDTTPLKQRISLEEQLVQLHKSEESSMMQQAADEEKVAQATRLTGEELKKIYQDQKAINEEINRRANGVRNGGTTPFQSYDSLRQSIASVLGIQEQQVKMANTEKDSYNQLSSTLKQLRQAYDALSKSDRNSDQGKSLVASIHEVERAMQQIRAQATRPLSLESLIGINGRGGLSEKTLDDIAYKMQRLSSYRSGLNVETQKREINTVNQEYDRLKKKMDEVMQKNQSMIASNNALGRSWNYMKNRLAFYFTVGASTQFIKNLIEVRSQYEMNERALGILINSAERGTQIFNELSQMALVSPYTLIELSAAAKQLTAYDIAARDVVDTTRRLADMASAVGVPIERLTYALGQIKAYGYLNSRDARMFANAGIPLVKQLSDYYTELEGKMVSTADVYDRMKKKAIDYNSVMSVITKMTDEGGKFFDFQAKMADTLKVRLANLTLAWNNMLNDMGKETQGVLTFGIGALRELFLHWRQLDNAIRDAAWILGLRTGFMLIAYAALKAGNAMGVTSKQMALSSVVGTKLAGVLRTLGQSIATIVKSPLTWWSLLALAAWDIFDAFVNADKATIEFNKSLRDSAKTTYEDLKKFAEQYKNIRDSLYTTETIGNLGGKETTITTPQNIEEGEAKKVWEAMREQIELSSHASDEYISKLLSIENVSERLRQGFQILDDIQTVSAALKEIGEDGIKVTQGWAAWWNAWQGADGLIGNVKDLQKEIQRLKDTGQDPNDKFTKVIDKDYATALERFRKDLKVTTDSVLDFINLNGWSGDTGKIDEVFKQVTDRLATQGNLDPQTAFTLQKDVEIARAKAAKEALEIRIADEKKALEFAADENSKTQIQKNLETLEQQKRDFDKFNGENRAYWNDFTKYIKERHISELTAAYNSMTDHGKKAMDFQSEEWQKRVHDWANRYEKSHNLATDSVFNRLRNWINDANTWSVFIKMTISTEDGKSVYKQLEEYDKAADDAWKTMQRLDKRISQLRKKGAKEVESAETGVIDLSRVSQDDKELTDALKERTQAQKDYNDALAKGGESKKESSVASKAQKQAESELAKALKDELKLIETVRSSYKDLTKEGASHADAVEKSVSGYEKSASNINAVLNKYGIGLDLSKFAGISNPHELQKMLREQLNALVGKAKPTEIQALEVELKKVDLDVDKYDLTKITKGLDNELDRLKDEYELAVSLDADPELGSMFADWMGIDMSDLPRTAQEYAKRATDSLNKAMKERKANIELPNLLNITDDDLRELQNRVGTGGITQTYVDEITKGVKAVRDVFRKEKEETSKDWNALIEKYGGLQAKLLKIYKDNVQQQASIVREFGTNDEQIKALDLISKIKISQDPAEIARLQEELAKVMNDVTSRNPVALKTYQATQKEQSSLTSKAMWDDFKDSDLYSMTFTDMANNSTQAIQLIIDKLNTLKDKVKEDPASMKALIKSLEDAENELNSRDPFRGIASSINTWIKATKEQKVAQEELKQANVEVAVSEVALKNAQDVGDKEAIVKAEQKLAQAQQKQVAAQGKVVQSGNKAKKAQEQLKTSFQNLSNELGNVSGLLGSVSQIFRAVGDDDTADAIDAINEGFSIMTTVIMGVNAALVVLESSNPWLLAMAAALSVIVGLVKFLSSNSNEKITEQVEESERAVRKLELAYKELEYAIENAYGTGILGAQKLAIENKKAQLEELRRQLSLEQSRSGKNRDEDKILDLKEKIVDLEHEITDSTNELVNSLLGVSSVGDAAENMMGAYIDALRDGEDAMKAFNESIDDMIANMVKKMLTTKIIQPWFERQWDVIQNDLTSRGAELAKEIEAEQLKLANARPTDMANEDSLVAALRDLGYSDDSIFNLMWKQGAGTWIKRSDALERLREEYNKSFSESERNLNELQRVYDDATSVTLDDIIRYAELLRSGQPVMDENMKAIQGLLGELGIMNNDTENNLSALQQGISGITEETAGALEAITSGMSQQVYYQSTLLEQIRDAIIGADSDIQLGVQGQILLQLQTSYQTQQAIQSILEGWSSPDGMSVRVQLES